MLRWDWSVHCNVGAGIFFYGSIAGLALLGLAGVCGRLRRARGAAPIEDGELAVPDGDAYNEL